MKVNERRTVAGVDWPLCVPPTVERDRRAWCMSTLLFLSGSTLLRDEAVSGGG